MNINAISISELSSFTEVDKPAPTADDITNNNVQPPKPQDGSDPEPTVTTGPIPDGGLEAWLQVLGSWSVMVLSWGLVNSFGVYQSYYHRQLLQSSSPSSISWIGSLQGSLLMWVGVISGPLFDAGFFKLQLVVGCFLVVFGQFMTSLCTAYYQVLLAQGISTGIGMGLIFLPATAVLAQYFQRRRALAIGIASTGSPLAGIVFPIIFSKLQPLVGFGWASRIIAFILLLLSVFPIAFMRYRVKPAGIRQLYDRTAMHDLPFMAMTFGAFFAFLTLYVAFFYIEVFDQQYHLSEPWFAPYTVTLLNVGSVFGRILPNLLADKFGSLNVIASCSAVSAILLFAWFGLGSFGSIVTFALLYGLFSGGVVSLTPSVVMTLTPDIKHLGARMGITFMCAGVSILVGPPIAGAILGNASHRGWMGIIGYSASGLVSGTAGYSLSRFLVWKEKGTLRA